MMKKPWGGRFKGKTAGAVESFTESVSFDRRLWKYDIQGSVAHAKMLSKQGIIPPGDAKKIIKGLAEIASEIESGRFRFKAALEDVHMNIEAALIEKIGPAGGRLHTARSRNDQIALDMRLYLRDELGAIGSLIKRLQRELLAVAEKHISVIMPGYTHLQRAQPVLLSHHLLAYVFMLQRDSGRMADCLKRADVLPLGACALAGTGLPIDRRYTARLLGFKAVAQNSMDAVSDRDFMAEFLSASSILMMHLSRLSEELVLWSSGEFSFVELPDAFATGSSIMPQKKNPDVPELIRAKTGRVYGNLIALLTLMKGLPLAYNRDLQEDKPPVFDTADTLKACLGVLSEMLPGLKFDSERMQALAGAGYSTATDLAEYLARRGVPFRAAHEITGRIVRHALESGKPLDALSIKELRLFSPLIGEDAYSFLSPRASVEAKTSEGGTSPRQVKGQLAAAKRLIKKKLPGPK